MFALDKDIRKERAQRNMPEEEDETPYWEIPPWLVGPFRHTAAGSARNTEMQGHCAEPACFYACNSTLAGEAKSIATSRLWCRSNMLDSAELGILSLTDNALGCAVQRFDAWDFRAYMEKKRAAQAMRKDFMKRQAQARPTLLHQKHCLKWPALITEGSASYGHNGAWPVIHPPAPSKLEHCLTKMWAPWLLPTHFPEHAPLAYTAARACGGMGWQQGGACASHVPSEAYHACM